MMAALEHRSFFIFAFSKLKFEVPTEMNGVKLI